MKVDAAAWQTVVASIYHAWDEKGIPQESGRRISLTQETISGMKSELHAEL